MSSGGLRRYVAELSLALAREFPEDTYTLLSDQRFALPAGAPVNLVQGAVGNASSALSKRWWLWGIQAAIKESGAELFHGTNYEVPYLGTAPSVMTIHDLSPWRDAAWHDGAARVRKRTPWLVRLRRARIIVTVSEAVRREVIAHFGVPAERVRAVVLAASALFRPIEDLRAAPRPFFLFVGTLEPRKNVKALIDAWRATKQETRADLVLVGRARSDFISVGDEAGLRFAGELPDAELPRLYSQALAFVYPSLYEGFGLPVLEAMQCGCPVITSNDPAIYEVSGEAALHAGTERDLANAMRSVASDTRLTRDLRQAGLARSSRFSWQATARATKAVYQEALA